MTPPNYFRFVKVESTGGGGDSYDGYTLELNESYEATDWGISNYSAAAFSSQLDENFETTSWTDLDGDFWS